jgi:hypothetical protein
MLDNPQELARTMIRDMALLGPVNTVFNQTDDNNKHLSTSISLF